jgi:4-hydroxy-tetrahydrodipicolinate reductase
MRIAIVGYGRMGQLVEEVLPSRGHEAGLIVDPNLPATEAPNAPGEQRIKRASQLSGDLLAGIDAAIEFSLADAVVSNVEAYARAGVSAVIGTTGWLSELQEVQQIAEQASIAILYGSNFSIGANLFFRIAEQAAALMAPFDEYDLMIHEMHHSGKQDSPSGTAVTLAEKVIAKVPGKTRIETGRLDRAPSPEELHVSSTRGGSVPGTHSLYLDSPADTIEIRHTARSRRGFALGAVRAAEWIAGHSGVFTVESFIDQMLKQRGTT